MKCPNSEAKTYLPIFNIEFERTLIPTEQALKPRTPISRHNFISRVTYAPTHPIYDFSGALHRHKDTHSMVALTIIAGFLVLLAALNFIEKGRID